MENKHAYLIMAHNQFALLEILLKALDYPQNDIYLHIDKKVKVIDGRKLKSILKYSKLFIIQNRVDVKWGEFSQIECELRLLETATSKHYVYYHLMSGVDMPLKKQEKIHQYFAAHLGTEFIHFDATQIDADTYKRVSKYVFFAGRSKNIFEKIAFKLLMMLEFGVDRGKKVDWVYQKGANWFSITDDLARYVVDNRSIIEKQFKYTRCADEVFLQKLVINSEFKNKVSSNNYCDNYETIRYLIDWKRGNPYVYRSADYEELMASDMLFARKFDWNIDKEIVLKLYTAISNDSI